MADTYAAYKTEIVIEEAHRAKDECLHAKHTASILFALPGHAGMYWISNGKGPTH
jgi:hypothetical protein